MPDQGLQIYPLRGSLKRLCRIVFLLIAPALLLGCSQTVERSAVVPDDTPTRAAVADVPLIKQEDFYCGPASLAMVLQWSGMDVTQSDIAAQAFSPGARGTYLADMVGTARRRGQLAVPISTLTDLLGEISAGHPVIIFQNLGLSWAPKWHYAVAVGYDLKKDQIFLNSGELDRMTMPIPLFLRTWERADNWALVVLPPDRLPASEDQWEILRAAAALERSGQAAAAEMVYANGAARWPENWVWPFGLGNARYQRGDLRGAVRAFERAMAIDPSIPEIRNNLDEVEAELATPAG